MHNILRTYSYVMNKNQRIGLLGRLGSYFSGRATLRGFGRRIAFSVIGMMTTAIAGHYYISHQAKKLQDSIYDRILTGTRPKLLYGNEILPRKDLEDDLFNWFVKGNRNNCDSPDMKQFGVIVGPTGTGKSALVRKICNKYPEGIIYLEIKEPRKFAKHLASALNFKIAPSNIFDILLGYYSSTYRMYWSLEDNQADAFDTIMGVLQQQASKYRSTTGRIPILFIDGADLLAKYDKNLFVRVLIQAKILANNGDLTIVFVSSEGAVAPVIQETSVVTRCNKFFEIGDVDDDIAINYLVQKGFPEKLSRKFVDYAGGRCIYLVNSEIHRYCAIERHPNIQDDEWYEMVIKEQFTWKLERQLVTLKLNEPYSSMLLSVLSKDGEITVGAMIQNEEMKNKENEGIKDAIANLVHENILRYTNINKLKWHGRPQERTFKNYHLRV